MRRLSDTRSAAVRLLVLVAVVAFSPAAVRPSYAADADKKVTITVKRYPKEDEFKNGSVWVFINEECVGTVGNGKTETFTFTPSGTDHNICRMATGPGAKTINYCNSDPQDIEASAGDTVYVDITNISWWRNTVYTSKFKVVKPEKAAAPPLLLSIPSKTHVGAVGLDRDLKAVVIKQSPVIRLARGTEKTIEDTLRIHHSVAITDGWKAGTEVRGKVSAVWVEAEAGIRAEIEKSTSKTYGLETEQKRSVLLRGETPVKVVWVEYYRTGTATIKIDGRDVSVPFEFKEDFDLLTEDVK